MKGGENMKKQKFKKPSMGIEHRRAWAGRLFVLPFTLGFLMFFLFPAAQSFRFSFSDVKLDVGGFDVAFTGMQNFRYLFTEDPDYAQNLVAALHQIIVQVPAVLIAALFFAILLNQKFLGRTAVRAIFFLPVIIASGVVMGIINSDSFATSLVSTSDGIREEVSVNAFGLQELLISIGLDAKIVEYFVTVSGSLYDLMWRTGIQMIIFLAALQSISPTLYEASAVEGASAWENFWMITIPMISPMILVNLVYTVVDAFTDGMNPVMTMVTDSTKIQQYDLAAAMSWLYFAIIGIVLAILLAIFRRATRDQV